MFNFGKWFWTRWGPRKEASPEWQRAANLIEAIDAGGVPLDPGRINDIARKLGLEVSTRASIDHTIQRIRDALAYHRSHSEN